MLQRIHRNLDILLLNVLFLGVGILLFYWSNKIEVLVATIATGISLSIAYIQSRIQDDKIFKELFTEFNHRYDSYFRQELEVIVDRHNSITEPLVDEDREIIIKYFNLCAEEYLWKTKHRIPEKIWLAWERGMIYYFNLKVFNDVLMQEKEAWGSYYGLFDHLKGKVENL